jgi:hypothetical protein
MKYPIFNDKLLLAGVLLLAATTAQATNFVIINQDGTDFGFNDPGPPAAGATGNTGTTLGEQRLNVLQAACDIWAIYLHSTVDIRVQAQFDALPGMTLAGASAVTIVRNFANAPLADTWYPVALGNSLAGTDLSTSNDINVTINVALDEDPALDDWYYGLDGNAPSDKVDLLDVLLHELGHGLGMISFVNEATGAFFGSGPGGPTPDVYSLLLFDTETNEAWSDMTSNERKASAINDPNLVWTGPYTTAAKDQILDLQRIINVTSPGAIAGEYVYEAAAFSPALPEIPPGGISGELVIVDDGDDSVGTTTDACQDIINDLTGKIAYIDRGECNFDLKVTKAQAAGAIAVIVANNVAEPAYVIMAGDGTGLTIPAVSISQADGATLVANSPGVMLTLGAASSSGLAGTSGSFLRIYAPNPLEQGSSVSHWTTAASPNLLMEPFINPDIRDDLDLSLTQMKDIGWVVIDIPYPYLTYPLWVLEAFDPATTQTAVGENPDGDELINVEEYFFGGDPENPDFDRLPVMQGSSTELDLVYTRSKLPTDLAYAYEISSDMTSWTDAATPDDYTSEVVSDISNSVEQVTLNLVPPAVGEEVFIRIRVVEP